MAPALALYGPVVPPVVIAEDGVHAERRFQPAQHRRPFGRWDAARDMAMADDVVAEQNGDVRLQRVGALDDAFDTPERHPGIAGVEVCDDGNPQLEIGGPLLRRKGVARDLEPL